MKISEHITYREATRSITAKRHGIDNMPKEHHVENMEFIADTVFEPLRKALGNHPIDVASFFRSKKLNKKIGGSKKSQHCKGEAMDLDADKFGHTTNRTIFEWIRENAVFDQLIWEHGNENEPEWVHVSKVAGRNRGEILIAYKNKRNKTRYAYYEEIKMREYFNR